MLQFVNSSASATEHIAEHGTALDGYIDVHLRCGIAIIHPDGSSVSATEHIIDGPAVNRHFDSALHHGDALGVFPGIVSSAVNVRYLSIVADAYLGLIDRVTVRGGSIGDGPAGRVPDNGLSGYFQIGAVAE